MSSVAKAMSNGFNSTLDFVENKINKFADCTQKYSYFKTLREMQPTSCESRAANIALRTILGVVFTITSIPTGVQFTAKKIQEGIKMVQDYFASNKKTDGLATPLISNDENLVPDIA